MEDYKSLEIHQLKKIAEIGIPEAQEELGYRLLKNGSSNALEEAFRWFSLSGAQGNSLAKFHLATMYKMGLGVIMDKSMAFKLYKESSDLGLKVAKYYLGEMYKYGEGVDKDEVAALTYMTESFTYTL